MIGKYINAIFHKWKIGKGERSNLHEKRSFFSLPKFEDFEYYLGEGELTKQTADIKQAASKIKGDNDSEKLKNIIIWMNQNVVRKKGVKDKNKFAKTADEILISQERTGCSDSAVLFSTLARALKIPTMQIVTFDKAWAFDVIKGKNPHITRGHFYVASYIEDVDGIKEWVLLDSDTPATKNEDIKLKKLRCYDQNISRWNYAFAYVRDFRDFDVNGIKIDSVCNMKYIQTEALKNVNIKDLKS